MRYALAGALAAAALEVGYSLYRCGGVDAFSLVSVGLILVFGGLSWRAGNPLYFKLKPVLLSILTGLVFLRAQLMDAPLLLFARASLLMGFGMLAHAGLVAWAALRLNNWWWPLARTAGAYVIILGVVVLASL